MEDLINDHIYESIIEEYRIFKITLEDANHEIVGYNIHTNFTNYAIQDENGELVKTNSTFHKTLEDAEKALSEIVHQRFEEQAQ